MIREIEGKVFVDMKTKDATGKASMTSLAVTEKCQAPRPKGCAGIFFQLFDWHRRFAKKKLFTRKLLPPPARAKHPSRSLKGDEMMPIAKLHYIADENKGGFPNLRKMDIMAMEQKHEMKSPGLVARLMGLESMPTVRREKGKKSISCESFGSKTCRLVDKDKGVERDEHNLEKEQMRHGRPQKLQKTGLCERQAVTRFGAEALQIKSVLSRSRKHNHLKGASPLKSPRVSSSSRSVSRTSRLMIDAATRMLEPKNRTKCALTYVSHMRYGSHSEVIIEEPLMSQSSCRKCGNMLDAVNLQQNMQDEEDQPLEDYVSFTSPSSSKQGSEMNDENKVFCKRKQEQEPLAVHETDRLSFERWRLHTEKSISKKDESTSSFDPKSSHEAQNQVRILHTEKSISKKDESTSSIGGDDILSSAKSGALKSKRAPTVNNSVSAAKDFVALNRSLSSQARPRVPIKADNSKADAMKKSRIRRDDSPTQIRKLREANHTVASTMTKQKKVDTVINMKDMAYEKEVTSKADVSGKSGVISFTFNAPIKNKNNGSSVDKRMAKQDSINEGSDSRELMVNGSEKKESLRKQLGLRGDALGALLEQKLKELTSQEDEEMSNNNNNNAYATPKQSTAMILQELIAALTADPLLSQDTDVVESENKSVQVKSKKENILGEVSNDDNRFSPGSVLDASFSNDSFISSSFDDSSGLNFKQDSMDCDVPQPLDIDNDLLDCATSLDKGRTSRDKVISLIVCINNLFSQLYLAGVRLEGSKLIHAKEINLHTELLFSNSTHLSSEDTNEFIINLSLLDELECLAASKRSIINRFSFFLDEKEVRKEFLFDCLLECLDSKYQPCSDFGYWQWRRLPPCLNTETLLRDVEAGLKKWEGLLGMSVDEMIDWEMSHSLGKWVDFDIEAFEKGIDIEEDILQNMIEQVVRDLF